MRDDSSLTVISHVARDLLQSGAVFKHAPNVIWEYVSNGLQYVEPGTHPFVRVGLAGDRISIADNGRGMDRSDLKRFFTMHGENEDRRQGRPGRGMFGTGKSAAFSIANTMRITTVRNGKRSTVELRRRDIEAAGHGGAVPVRELGLEVPVSDGNGTLIELIDLKKVRVDKKEIVGHLEKHLRHWRGVTVEVDGVPVEATVPPIQRRIEFIAGTEAPSSIRGSVLTLNIAKAPLSEDDRGVAVLSNGVLHAVTLAGAERKEFANYLFGEIDVPALAEPHEGVDAYDMSRSGQLNPENKIVIETLAFIGRHIEAVRRELVELDKNRRKLAEAERLQSQADEIAKIINEDYVKFAKRFRPVQTPRTGSSDTTFMPVLTDAEELALVVGAEVPAVENPDETAPTEPGSGVTAATSRDIEETDALRPPALAPAAETSEVTANFETVHKKPRRRTGGFDVRYDFNGNENPRCLYDRENRTLLINLDHPQLAAAKGEGSTEDLNFRRLSFEVAFTEYAISLAQENVQAGFYQDMFHPLNDARERIDSLARKASHLFSRSA
jgi:hypothetical protein